MTPICKKCFYSETSPNQFERVCTNLKFAKVVDLIEGKHIYRSCKECRNIEDLCGFEGVEFMLHSNYE